MRRVIKQLASIALVGVTLAACSSGEGSTEDPREPGEECRAAIYNQEKIRDGVLWRCTRQWLGNRYTYYWTAIRDLSSASSDPSAVPGDSINVLEGSTAVVRNGAGEPTWTYTIGGGEEPPALALSVAGNGTITVDPTSFVTPQQLQCFGEEGVDCLGFTLRGTGGPQAMTINSTTGTITTSFGIIVDVEALQGFAGLGPDCQIGPVSGTVTANDYDSTTGTATLEASGMALGSVDSCGDQNETINSVLGLPGTVDVSLLAQVNLGQTS